MTPEPGERQVWEQDETPAELRELDGFPRAFQEPALRHESQERVLRLHAALASFLEPDAIQGAAPGVELNGFQELDALRGEIQVLDGLRGAVQRCEVQVARQECASRGGLPQECASQELHASRVSLPRYEFQDASLELREFPDGLSARVSLESCEPGAAPQVCEPPELREFRDDQPECVLQAAPLLPRALSLTAWPLRVCAGGRHWLLRKRCGLREPR